MLMLVVAAAGKPVSSKHRSASNGLEGWTLNYIVPEHGDNDHYPRTLVISRKGRIVRRIHCSAFIWRWTFLDGGKQIAYECSPFHFGEVYVLEDSVSGKQLESYEEPEQPETRRPDWMDDLDKAPDWS